MSFSQTAKRVVGRALKRALRPLTSRAYALVDVHIDSRVLPVRGDLEALRRDIDRTVSIVLNALSNQNADSRVQARDLDVRLAKLLEEFNSQIEQLRKELVGGPDLEHFSPPPPGEEGDAHGP